MLKKCFDANNAFYTIDRAKLTTWIEGTKQDRYSFVQNAIQQIVENSTAIVEGADDTLIISPSSGVPPGLCSGTAMFNCVYQQALSKDYDEIKHLTNMVNATRPISGNLLNMAFTSFVDDLCTTVDSNECTQISSMLHETVNKFDNDLAEYSMSQNADRAAIISLMYGKGYREGHEGIT